MSPSGTDLDSMISAVEMSAAIAPLPRPLMSMTEPISATSPAATLTTSPVLTSRTMVSPRRETWSVTS